MQVAVAKHYNYGKEFFDVISKIIAKWGSTKYIVNEIFKK